MEETKIEEVEEIPDYVKEIEPKLVYEIEELYPKFQPFDENDTLEMISTKMEAHRIWKNSLAKIYPVVENKDTFLEQIMIIFYSFNQNKDSNKISMEFDRFRSDIVKNRQINKVNHVKLFLGTQGNISGPNLSKPKDDKGKVIADALF